MSRLHISKVGAYNFVPKEGQRDLMCSNKESLRCPSFGFNSSNNVPEDVALDYFASILVEAFLDQKEYERNKLHESKKEGGGLLPSIKQGAG